LRFVLGKNQSIYAWTRTQVISGQKVRAERDLSRLLEAMEMNSKSAVDKELAEILALISKTSADSVGKIYDGYLEVIFHINKFLYDTGYSSEEVFGKDLNFYEKIQNFETAEEINIWIGNMVHWILAFFKERQSAGTKSQIEKAQEFIRRNYDKDLPLKVVSEYVSLSENYFSAQFSKYVGTNFSEYISSIRIEKAKKYLETTDFKMYDICNRIGYANVEHFSRVFKKLTGFSPLRYRNHHRKPQ
jgi:Response regulator containing CheY-like receiver domain and AraC-type DNA-binding domain